MAVQLFPKRFSDTRTPAQRAADKAAGDAWWERNKARFTQIPGGGGASTPEQIAAAQQALAQRAEQRAEARTALQAQTAASSKMPKWFPFAIGGLVLAAAGFFFLRRKKS